MRWRRARPGRPTRAGCGAATRRRPARRVWPASRRRPRCERWWARRPARGATRTRRDRHQHHQGGSGAEVREAAETASAAGRPWSSQGEQRCSLWPMTMARHSVVRRRRPGRDQPGWCRDRPGGVRHDLEPLLADSAEQAARAPAAHAPPAEHEVAERVEHRSSRPHGPGAVDGCRPCLWISRRS